jgi:regulatory protein
MKDAARDEAAGAMAAAMASLARRSLSRAELDAKLRSRGFAEDAIASVLSRLTELKLIDDDALAERVARRRFEAGRAGRFRVRAELRRRGVAEDVLERAIERTVPMDGELASARDELARFLRGRNKRDEPREKARAAAFRHLVARGFPADLVRDLLGVSL